MHIHKLTGSGGRENSSGESWRSSFAGALLSVVEAEVAPLRAADGCGEEYVAVIWPVAVGVQVVLLGISLPLGSRSESGSLGGGLALGVVSLGVRVSHLIKFEICVARCPH